MQHRRSERGSGWAFLAITLLVALAVVGCGEEDPLGEPEFASGAIAGVNARIGPIDMRDVAIQTPPRGQAYPKGSTARVSFVAANERGAPDALVGISAPMATDVRIFADQSADGTYEPTPTLAIPVTADAPAGAAEAPYYAELRNLTSPIRIGHNYVVTFRFARAGELQMTIPVALPR